jgi:hypothetical protein
VPICLEELWPAAVWEYAEQQGWLRPRSQKGLIGERLLQRLAEEDERLSDLIDDAWRPNFERRVIDDEACQRKSAGQPISPVFPVLRSRQ